MGNISFFYWNYSDCFSKCQLYWAFPEKKKMLSGKQFADQVDNRNQEAIISYGEGSEFAGYISERTGSLLGMRREMEN